MPLVQKGERTVVPFDKSAVQCDVITSQLAMGGHRKVLGNGWMGMSRQHGITENYYGAPVTAEMTALQP